MSGCLYPCRLISWECTGRSYTLLLPDALVYDTEGGPHQTGQPDLELFCLQNYELNQSICFINGTVSGILYSDGKHSDGKQTNAVILPQMCFVSTGTVTWGPIWLQLLFLPTTQTVVPALLF